MFELLQKLLTMFLLLMQGAKMALAELERQNQDLQQQLQVYAARIAELEAELHSSPQPPTTSSPPSTETSTGQDSCQFSDEQHTDKRQRQSGSKVSAEEAEKAQGSKPAKSPRRSPIPDMEAKGKPPCLPDSETSHLSPGKDVTGSKRRRKPDAERQRSGGRPGHQGHTWDKKDQVTETHHCYVDRCELCGADLSSFKAHQQPCQSCQYEEEIPERVQTFVRAYVRYTVRCPYCGHWNKATLPAQMQQVKYMRYGPNIYARVCEAWAYHFVSFERITQWLNSVFTLTFSEGTVWNIIKKMAAQGKGVYERIKAEVASAPVAGCDETVIYIDGKKYWLWVFQMPHYTWLHVSPTRAYSAIKTAFPEGFPQSVLVTDRYAAQLKTPSRAKQICLVHLLRDLKGLLQKGCTASAPWLNAFQELLADAIALRELMTDPITPAFATRRQELEQKLDQLLAATIPDKAVETFRKSMVKNRNRLLYFLYELAVPFHNNDSEKAIRHAKIKLNVSLQFRSETGASCYAIIRSIVDTCIKQKRTIAEAFEAMAKGLLEEWFVKPPPAPD